jgi:hypothetical protein
MHSCVQESVNLQLINDNADAHLTFQFLQKMFSEMICR